MKYKAFNWMLLAAIICGLSITVSSCKDDNNDDNKSEEQKEQEAQVKGSKFWSVVGQLVSVDDVTDDYEGKTFEPTYGLPDGTNETTRIVNTNDMRTAAQRFANLVNATGIDENTPSYTWSDPEIGSMTYTRGGTPAEWATVDVDIKAVPRLQRIIYRAGGEGDNASVNGKAYYRFGDVVSRQVTIKNDQKKNNDTRGTITEYWICVRPSFGPEGKGDSHWVCVNTVSDKNYKYYKASTGADYWLPTSLKTDKENMQNFAELLYAICNPSKWSDNISNHHTDGKLWGFSGVPFFTDFKKANLHLHNEFFWENVQQGWIKKDVIKNALNLPSFNYLKEELKKGLHLLYNGYSWWFTTSWDCELYEVIYTNGTKDEELNMHHVEFKDWEKNMQNVKFDVRDMGYKLFNYNTYFDNDNKIRLVIRHATGKELADDKKYDPKKAISGVKEEYRYYKDVVDTPDLSGNPESTPRPENAKTLQFGYFRPGVFIQDEEGSKWLCIYSWLNDPTAGISTDQKARFISLDGFTSATENIGSKTGNFLSNRDLVPESQAILVAGTLQEMTSTDVNNDWGKDMPPFNLIRQKFREYFNRDLTSWNMVRDTAFTYNDQKISGFSRALSIFYIPSGGRQPGTQPYFRFILDGTHVGPDRDRLPAYMKYPLAKAFRKYNDGSGRQLDATHLFTASNFITEAKPVKADMWSNCKNRDTGLRAGDFKASDRYTVDFDWKLFLNNKQYLSAYHEYIVPVRYLEIEDNSETFLGTYGGKKYTVIYEPERVWDATLRYGTIIGTLSNFHNNFLGKYGYEHVGCMLDNEKYEPNIFKWLDAWDL